MVIKRPVIAEAGGREREEPPLSGPQCHGGHISKDDRRRYTGLGLILGSDLEMKEQREVKPDL